MPAATNPARLKLALAIHGVATGGARPDGTSVELALADDIWVHARVAESSPWSLTEEPGLAAISHAGIETAVRVVHPPAFASRFNARGIALGDIAAMRGTYATVTLGGGCGRSAAGRTCALCLGRELTEHAGEVWPVVEVVEAVRGAFEDGDAEFVHLVLGYFPGDDAGVQVMRPYLDAIHHHFDTIVAVTMHPPADLRAIDLTYAEGVDILSYNLEAADDETMRAHFPGRTRFIGRERYMNALAHAARIFPRGSVWSDLMLDLGPIDSIQRAIAELAASGAVPTFGVSGDGGVAPVNLETAAALAADAFDAVTRAGIGLNWMRDVSTSLTPLDARSLVPDAPQLQSLLHQFSRNRFGAMTTRSLARMRRRLRVKRVRASFDSSHL